MSNAITEARLDELETLKKRKETLQDKIRAEGDKMQELIDSMNTPTKDAISSSSKAAKDRRRKDTSTLDHQDVIDACEMAIARLEEDYANVEQELEDLKKLMGHL
jgi:chromosome segregation ATPase